jgi:hypothetical protein
VHTLPLSDVSAITPFYLPGILSLCLTVLRMPFTGSLEIDHFYLVLLGLIVEFITHDMMIAVFF